LLGISKYGNWTYLVARRAFFEWYAKQHKIVTPEDWYKVTVRDIKKHGGGTLLNYYYQGSLIKGNHFCYII
jgi:hypothetical protein